jgi:SRSO17 transposase
MAEALGERIPDRMQRFLYRVPWDADAARDRLQQFVIETFGDEEAIAVVDETSGCRRKGRILSESHASTWEPQANWRTDKWPPS